MKKTTYDKLTSKYQKQLMSSLAEFVSINSVYDEKTVSEKDPFGIGVSTALNFIVELAKKDGFEVNNYDNKVVEIIFGRGSKNLTIMAHADVVPAGTGWKNPPFKMVEEKGVLYGRGVADDKGPLLACYYAFKALRDKGLLGGYQIRFLVGGNEESGSLCMEHYFHTLKKSQPTLGFSPDSDFPLIYAEKGIITFSVTGNVEIPGLFSIKGGEASNAVIERCEVKHEIDNQFLDFIMTHFKRNEAEIHTSDDITTVSFLGKAAHGSTPEKGVNAGMMAIGALADFTKDPKLLQLKKLFTPLDASGYKCSKTSKDMGHNSSNVGIVKYDDNVLSLTCNFRYVDNCDKKQLLETIKEVCKPFTVKVVGEAPLLYYPKDTPLIKTLLSSYQIESGDYHSEPLAIGGGTYAKEADNTVAFGMQFPGWESNMHSPGEQVKKADLFKAMSIYARAIVDLGNLLKDED